MATSFEEIYCLNSVIKIDKRLNNKPSYELYNLYWKYLQFAISYFQYDCRKKLLDLVPFSLTEYSFVGDGVNNIFELTPAPSMSVLLSKTYNLVDQDSRKVITEGGLEILADINESINPNFYITSQITCSEPSKVITNYIWDGINNTITLVDYTPAIGEKVSIVAYEIGKFNCDLNFDEKRILAEGMNIPFYEEQLTNSKILNFATYGGSIKMHSQAEQIKNLNDTLKTAKRELEGDISNYSYRTAPIYYLGLGGRTVCWNPLRYKR